MLSGKVRPRDGKLGTRDHGANKECSWDLTSGSESLIVLGTGWNLRHLGLWDFRATWTTWQDRAQG